MNMNEIRKVILKSVQEYVKDSRFLNHEWTNLYTGTPVPGEKICCFVVLCDGEDLRATVVDTLSWWKSAATFSIDLEVPRHLMCSLFMKTGIESEMWLTFE